MQCSNPIRIYPRTENNPYMYPDGIEVPCNKCLQCRIKKRTEWSIRMLHELSSHHNSMFVTLTYEEKQTPPNKSLVKKDLQNFFKRLRKQLDNKTIFEQLDYYIKTEKMEHKIKYFASGEYGNPPKRLPNGQMSEGYRPHYHAIIFGLGLDEKERVIKAWKKCDWSNEKIYKESFGLAEPDSIRYVAQYIDKKLSGDEAEEQYTKTGREPVFKISSNGLGKEHVINNCEQYVNNLYMSNRGKKMSFPRYYLKFLNLSREDRQKIKDVVSEKEKDLVEEKSGINCNRNEAYRSLKTSDIIKIERKVKANRCQNEKNLSARLNLRSRKKL